MKNIRVIRVKFQDDLEITQISHNETGLFTPTDSTAAKDRLLIHKDTNVDGRSLVYLFRINI